MVIEGKYTKKDLLTEISRKEAIKKYRPLFGELSKDSLSKESNWKHIIASIDGDLGELSSKYIGYILQSTYLLDGELDTLVTLEELVKLFDKLIKKGKLQNKDIYSKEYRLKTVGDEVKLLDKLKLIDKGTVTKSEEKKMGAEKIYNDSKYLVIVPKSYKASCYYGSGTKWCTTSSENHLMTETKRAVLYYVIDKDKTPYEPKREEGDDLSKIAIQQFYNGSRKIWDSKDKSLTPAEKTEIWNNYPDGMKKAIMSHFDAMKAKRDEKHGDIESTEEAAIVAAWGDSVSLPLTPSTQTYHGMSVYEDDDGGEYAVGDENTFREAQKENLEQFIDEMGYTGLSEWAWNYIKENFVDKDHFEALQREDAQYFIDDIRDQVADDDETYDSRLEEEMAEAGVDDEEDFLEHLVDGWGDPIEWYIMNFGDEGFEDQVMSNIDDEEALDWLVDNEGDTISGYEVEYVDMTNTDDPTINGDWYYVVEIA